ncbi:ComEA family DNA-binding protein [Acinetobacter qingfengensis]|uniref:ComEA family DNA-binding protein n=1 Tax=Acinetobacter qingfengensis TaxID=1262585 RepID=A0A1E7QXB8_9GAMM|nr:ComEA family DNA-binding protein [Acinetobacter qingfengensis]OEY91728.1 hypothetical protein BJI46_06185 [Acinetobacter qingfengensis]
MLKKFSLVLISYLFSSTVLANTAQQMDYHAWKVRQEQHDLRLKQYKSSQNIQVRAVQLLDTSPAVHPQSQPQTVILGEQFSVNINTATVQELSAKLSDIGTKKARAIVQYRQQYGAFKRIEDLQNVKGIGEKTFEKNRNKLKIRD